MKVRGFYTALMTGVACGAFTLPAQAQNGPGLEEIVVTATKMGATRLQDTPLAITAVSADQMDRTGMSDVRDLISLTPNLEIAQNTDLAQIYIRGIGSNNVFAGSDPSSTVHLDGVYMARPAAQLMTFLDVERVEVLRGPQGTLYGRNSVGGTVNIISRKPDNDFRAKVQGTYGNYDQLRLEGYVSGPVVEDKVAVSLSAMRSRHDGYRKNIVATGNDYGREDLWMGRGQIRFTPSQDLDVLLSVDYMDAEGTPDGATKLRLPFEPVVDTTIDDYTTIALNTPGVRDSYQWGVSGDVTYSISDAVSIKSLTSYRESKLGTFSDTDASSLTLLRTDLAEKQNQFSEELNLSGQMDRLKYVLGLYYFEEEISTDTTVNSFAAGLRIKPNPLVETTAWAAYAQASYDISEQLSVTAGIRYTDEDKDMHQNYSIVSMATETVAVGPVLYDLEGSYTAWTPKFGIEYRASEDVLVYASATRGFKSGGYNFATSSPVNGYDPEFLWSYEAGIKNDLLDKRLRINGSAFYYDYTDLQVQAFIVPGSINITNAADATVKGLEFELLASPAEGFQVGGTLAYLDATYKTYNPAFGAGGVQFDASGNRLNSSPKWSYSLFAQYDFAVGDMGGMFVRGEYSWKDDLYFTPENTAINGQDSFGLLNASIGFASEDGRWKVTAYGRNLTNEEYVVSTVSFTPVVGGQPGQPRTYGLRLAVEY